MSVIGGGSVSLGGLTKYQALTAQPYEVISGRNRLSFSHSLGVVPRFIVISPADGSTIENGKYYDYIICDSLGCPGYYSSSDNAYTNGASSKLVTSMNNYATNSFTKTSTDVAIAQSSSTLTWNLNATYKVELWG